MLPEEKLMRVIFGKRAEDDFDLFFSEINGVSLHTALMEVLDSLQYSRSSSLFKKRYKRVILLRFGFEDGRSKTLEQVGKEFNLARERIRQIESKTLRLLRHPSRVRALEVFIKTNTIR